MRENRGGGCSRGVGKRWEHTEGRGERDGESLSCPPRLRGEGLGAPMAPCGYRVPVLGGIPWSVRPRRDADPRKGMADTDMDTGYPATFWEARKGIQGPAPTSTDQTLWHESWEGSEAGVPLGQHTCEACGQPQHMPRGEPHWPPAAQDPWVPVRIPHRRVVLTRPLTTFPCLSFPRVLTRARLWTPWPVVGSQAEAPPARSGRWPLPRTPGPRRRGPGAGMCSAQWNVPNHSQMCTAASPTPLRSHRGSRRAPGTPGHSTAGLSPSPAGPCPATGPSPVPSRGVAAPRPGSAPAAAGGRARQEVPRGQGWPCPRPIEAPQTSPGAGAAGSCGVLPRTPGPGARREQPSGKGLSDGIWVPAVTARREAAVPATWPLM